MEGFLTDIETALLFYRICRRYQVPTEAIELRRWIMGQLVKRHKAKYLRDISGELKGKNVWKIE